MIYFLDRTPKAQATKAKLNKQGHAKPKSFCTGKEMTDKMKKQPIGWEKIFANHNLTKHLLFNIYK